LNDDLVKNSLQSQRSGIRYPASNIEHQTSNIEYHRIDFDLPGSNPNCEIVTAGTSSDYTNYYTTGTPVEGVTSVHSYETVTYKNIYPGVDLQFISSNEIPFKYNFVVHPGGRIDDIKIRINGPEKVKRISDGLCFDTELGDVEESIPSCFYRMDGADFPVDGRFYKIEKHLYGFRVDRPVPEGSVLFIDPVPTRRWGTYYGGPADDFLEYRALKISGDGTIVIGGGTNSFTNIATTGAWQTTIGSPTDGFLSKFSTDGQLLWGTYYGGGAGEEVFDCSIDQNGNIFIAGFTGSTTNIASPGAFQTIKRGGNDGFLAKFTPSGTRIWGTYYGGNEVPASMELIRSCENDTNGNIYCSGETTSPDFIATPGAHQTTLLWRNKSRGLWELHSQ
jgi:hypothetical protein